MLKSALVPFSETAKNFKLGKYRHYKGGMYRARMVGHDSENPTRELVVYESTEHPGDVWIRPLTMFLEMVNVDGVQKHRFEWVGE